SEATSLALLLSHRSTKTVKLFLREQPGPNGNLVGRNREDPPDRGHCEEPGILLLTILDAADRLLGHARQTGDLALRHSGALTDLTQPGPEGSRVEWHVVSQDRLNPGDGQRIRFELPARLW